LISLDFEQTLDDKLRQQRYDRYAWQSVAKLALPKERVSRCLRYPFNKSDVEVYKHKETKKAFYSGLAVCGSVWHCPVCAAKISERRRQELKHIFDSHLKTGGKIALLTLTFSHKKNDSLKNLLQKFSKASGSFRSGKRYAKLRDQMGMIGSVRAFEITYGSNGFHPHTHTLLFYTNEVDLKDIKDKMYDLWFNATNKQGLKINKEHGLDLKTGEKADEYLAKHGTWSLDREMTKSHIKKGKTDKQSGERSLTPFDFLRMYLDYGDDKYLKLFQEYGTCLKGKVQLAWHGGLKQLYQVEDKSDEQLATESREEADLLGMIDYFTWKRIVKTDKRATFLDLCEKKDFETALKTILDDKSKENKKAPGKGFEQKQIKQLNN